MARDFYAVLGVAKTATGEEIQRAYRTLARRSHPDVNKEPGAEDRFKEITEAYRVLSDPSLRREYDARASVPSGGGFRGGPAAGGGPGGGFQDFADFEDLFGFGPVRGADAEATITITLEDSYRGGHRTVTLPDGTRLGVTIPRGIAEGQRLRLAGQGAGGLGGGPRGDLHLVVRFAPDPRYTVDGRDLTVRLPVAPWEAALGAKVPLRTPAGEVLLDVPRGSSSGRRLRLRGQGLPGARPGDLYAEVRVMVPPDPTPQERRLFEELARASAYDPRSAS
ncbi:DnaJ C-terminal domain-containing protein [Dactylosporangium sp. NPDC000244]|uniref:DnaJ C-terminal domain-containing protein n=1 Tax=Dactylosporangium sp. NPDC000244 TaxID=3154365 RepID=UPI003322297B